MKAPNILTSIDVGYVDFLFAYAVNITVIFISKTFSYIFPFHLITHEMIHFLTWTQWSMEPNHKHCFAIYYE